MMMAMSTVAVRTFLSNRGLSSKVGEPEGKHPRRYGREGCRFRSVCGFAQTTGQSAQGLFHIFPDDCGRLILSLEQEHGREGGSASNSTCLQFVLAVAQCFPDDPLDAISPGSVSSGPSDRNPYLEWSFKTVLRNGSIHDADTACANGLALRVLTVEQGFDEPFALETAGERKAEPAAIGGWRGVRLAHGVSYFPGFVSLTVRFLRPLERRRASTRRPFLVAIRERKPCLLARLRRLGWYVRFMMLGLVCPGQDLQVGSRCVTALMLLHVGSRQTPASCMGFGCFGVPYGSRGTGAPQHIDAE